MREHENDRKGLIDLIDSLNKTNITMIEVGSYAGESAEIFVQTGKIKTIICIDPWVTDPNGDNLNSYNNMDIVEKRFDDVKSKHQEIIKFKGTLDTFIKSELFQKYKNNIDFIYIDGLHTYEGCKSDIDNSISTIKPKIAIGGHDYADYPSHIKGVKKAVDDAFKQLDQTFVDTSWIKFQK